MRVQIGIRAGDAECSPALLAQSVVGVAFEDFQNWKPLVFGPQEKPMRYLLNQAKEIVDQQAGDSRIQQLTSN